MLFDQKGLNNMGNLPQKPEKPYRELKTFQRQNLHSDFFNQEVLEPFHDAGKPLPQSEEISTMYKDFLQRVYDQPDPK